MEIQLKVDGIDAIAKSLSELAAAVNGYGACLTAAMNMADKLRTAEKADEAEQCEASEEAEQPAAPADDEPPFCRAADEAELREAAEPAPFKLAPAPAAPAQPAPVRTAEDRKAAMTELSNLVKDVQDAGRAGDYKAHFAEVIDRHGGIRPSAQPDADFWDTFDDLKAFALSLLRGD